MVETSAILKFRTMDVLEDGCVIPQARRNDPRVTRFGHILSCHQHRRAATAHRCTARAHVADRPAAALAVAHDDGYVEAIATLRIPAAREARPHWMGSDQRFSRVDC